MILGTVGVLGAGHIGVGVVTDLVLHGIPTVVVDLTKDILERAQAEILNNIRFAPALSKTLPRASRDEALRRITLTTDLQDLTSCDFIIENVTEDWGTKKPLYERLGNLVPPEVWEPRYDEINAFERELVDAGTRVVKVAMFVSLDEQKKRLGERLERPDKYWKFNPADIDERGYWPAYQEAYQVMLDRTSTEYAPWHVIPADRKWFARLSVTELLINAMDKLELDWPPAQFDIEEQKRRLAEA